MTQAAGNRPKAIFFPNEREEQIKGWLLHCHKSRDRHDMTARWLDRRQWKVAVLGAVFSALAGVTLASGVAANAGAALGVQQFEFWFGAVIGVFALVASFLTVLQKEARYGERSEIHQRKAEAYKSLIWDIEQKLPRLAETGSDVEGWCNEWHAKFRLIEEEQQIIIPNYIIDAVETRQYQNAIFVNRAEQLLPGQKEKPAENSG